MTPGWWTPRRRINREVSVPGGWQRLSRAGTIGNLEVAAGRAEGPYAGGFPFLDSDAYKWLEAVGWTLADPDLPESVRTVLEAHVNELVDLLAAAQEPDGYLDSWFQVKFPGERFAQLEWGHELYCAGHLIQAAIAHHRSVGDDRLLAIARRFADLIVASFGPGEGRNDRICGHAEIETALVELSRTTGQDAYLRTAARFVDRHGTGTLVAGSHGAKYFQDHEPLRQADQVAGHAVRQLYLLSGAADVAAETGDVGLLDACARLWADMAGTKTYLTGGVGAHHADEAFGDPYELPAERANSETCAAIASILLGSRLLLATGEARYADLVERTLYNAFLAGTSTDGQSYAYANPLAVRAGHLSDGSDQDPSRQEWFDCACCPPNVMRLIASLEHYAVAGADDAVYVHQYLAGRWEVDVTGGTVVVAVDTHYPADETILIRVVDPRPARPRLGPRRPNHADRRHDPRRHGGQRRCARLVARRAPLAGRRRGRPDPAPAPAGHRGGSAGGRGARLHRPGARAARVLRRGRRSARCPAGRPRRGRRGLGGAPARVAARRRGAERDGPRPGAARGRVVALLRRRRPGPDGRRARRRRRRAVLRLGESRAGRDARLAPERGLTERGAASGSGRKDP